MRELAVLCLGLHHHKLFNFRIRSGRRGRCRRRNTKRWDRGVISSVMFRNLESHCPREASVEVPTCKPDTVRAKFFPHLLRGSDHALQPIYILKRFPRRCWPQIKSNELLHFSECPHVLPCCPQREANSVQHDRPALAHSLGVFYIST